MGKMSASLIEQNGESCKVTVTMGSKVMIKFFIRIRVGGGDTDWRKMEII